MSSEIKTTAISSVDPRKGVTYLVGPGANSNNPTMFAEPATRGPSLLIVACRGSLKEFSVADFDAALSHYRTILRGCGYVPSDEPGRALVADTPQQVDPAMPINQIPLGAAMRFLAGYSGPRNHPMIFAHGGDPSDRLAVIGHACYEEYSIDTFPVAVKRFRDLIERIGDV